MRLWITKWTFKVVTDFTQNSLTIIVICIILDEEVLQRGNEHYLEHPSFQYFIRNVCPTNNFRTDDAQFRDAGAYVT